MNKYKTFEELKEELGDKFEDYMYKANIELLNKLDKIKEYIEKNKYKKMGGYGDNEDEDIEVCLFEDDIWEIEKLLEEVE